MGVPPTDWLIDPGTAYLNHGGYGALPVPVAAAADALRRDVEANPTDLFTRRWQDSVNGVRARVASLLHSQPADLVFVPNATAGTATVLNSLAMTEGDELVVTDHRYPAVRSQVDVLAERRGLLVRQEDKPLDMLAPEEIVDLVMPEVVLPPLLVDLGH